MECTALGDFGSNYSKVRPTKYQRQETTIKKNDGRQQENNAIVQHAVDDILLQDKDKLSVEDETHKNIDGEVDEDELYNLEQMVFDEKEWHKSAFESKLNIYIWYKTPNGMDCIHENEVNKIAKFNLLHEIINPSTLLFYMDS